MKKRLFLILTSFILTFLLFIGLALIVSPPTQAAGIAPAAGSQEPKVNQPNAGYLVNFADDTDDGTCDVTHCSLREAINAANNAAGADTITFNLSPPSTTIVLSGTPLPTIVDHVSIDGSTAQSLTVSGNNANRIMWIAASKAVTITSLTLVNGNALPGDGGAIANYGSLTLVASDIISNTARNGGGIYSQDTSATINNSTLISNTATLNGGGLYTKGTGVFTINNSKFIGNEAVDGGGLYAWNESMTVYSSTLTGNEGKSGGGIYNAVSILTVSSSTVSGNSTTAGGGGLLINSGPLHLNSSTVSGNSALVGGGLFNGFNTTTITNTTFSTNTATNFAGGIWNQSGDVTMFGTVIANSSNGDCQNGIGTTTSATYTIIESTGAEACNLTSTNGNLIGQDPLLEPLADNGGPTLTHALLPDSPALDKITFGVGGCGTTYTTDQRGVQRPQGDACDIGAYEFIGDTYVYLPMIVVK